MLMFKEILAVLKILQSNNGAKLYDIQRGDRVNKLL
jgi:hypothetical protein